MSIPLFMAVQVERLTPAYWNLDRDRRSSLNSDLDSMKERFGEKLVSINMYLSVRSDSDLIFWFSSADIETIEHFKRSLRSTLREFSEPAYGMISLYEDSPYLKESGDLASTLRHRPSKYFVSYPMVKSPEWYLTEYEKRKKIMAEHIGMAVSHPENRGIRSYTTYSFGLGDQEFVVLYETDTLVGWSHVTAKLREAEAHRWVTREHPIFIGIFTESLPID
ncbi:MAG: chlorite dismutase family protein [Thermoplasmata archaeon]